MIKTLLSSLKPAINPDGKTNTSVATPDLNRVLKPFEPILELDEEVEPELIEDLLSPEIPDVPSETVYGTPDDMADRAAAAVDSLSGQYETWMEADLQRLGNAWQAIHADQPSTEKSRALFMTAHNIRGVAASYGYPAISRLCGSLCKLLSDSQPGGNHALINIHVEACRAAYNPLSQTDGANAVADAVCDALEAKVALMVVN